MQLIIWSGEQKKDFESCRNHCRKVMRRLVAKQQVLKTKVHLTADQMF